MAKKNNTMIDEHGIALSWNETSLTTLAKNCDIYNSIYPRAESVLLPDIPKDILHWNYTCRPVIKGEPNRLKYLPMVVKVLQDQHPWIQLLWARQWGKTTLFATILGHAASTNWDYDQTYVNFEQEALKTFSDNKFRKDVFSQYPLSEYIEGISKFGSMSKVSLKTRSTIDMVTALNNWRHIQGKSNKKMVIDEGNDINWVGFRNALESQADTMGDLLIGGVGGYVDTLYHKQWLSTNQMEFHFKRGESYQGYNNNSWRADLEFDSNGLVYGDYMLDVLDGDWTPQAPKHTGKHGYHLSQIANPRIPITRLSAVHDYKVSEDYSIEAKIDDVQSTINEIRRNVFAEFVKGELKPITTKMMLALYDKTQSLTKADDVDHNNGDIFIGIDWGGGGKTIVWIWQCIDNKAPIFKLLWVERIETADVEKQKDFCINLIDSYEAKKIVVDAGGGTRQVQALQSHYGSRVIRNSYHPRPEKPLPTREESLKQSRELRYVIDRTFAIDRVIDLINHPYKEKDFITPRIILPGLDYSKIKWIDDQFTALEGEKSNLKSTGQTYIKYTHKDTEPDDALQSCVYAVIAWDLGKSNNNKIEFKPINGKSDPFGDGYRTT